MTLSNIIRVTIFTRHTPTFRPGDFVTVSTHATFDLRPVSYPARINRLLPDGEALVYPTWRGAAGELHYRTNVRRVGVHQLSEAQS